MAQLPRKALGDKLRALLGSDNVYFQPTENVKLKYPAIIYGYETTKINHANNSLYLKTNRYSITYIDRSPDSDIPNRILDIPMTTVKSKFITNGLYHYNYSTYH